MIDLSAYAVEHVPCDYCGARPGNPCLSRSVATRSMSASARLKRPTTRRASYPHSARTDAVYAAWREGYDEGIADGRQQAERHLRAAAELHVGEVGDAHRRGALNAAADAIRDGRKPGRPA